MHPLLSYKDCSARPESTTKKSRKTTDFRQHALLLSLFFSFLFFFFFFFFALFFCQPGRRDTMACDLSTIHHFRQDRRLCSSSRNASVFFLLPLLFFSPAPNSLTARLAHRLPSNHPSTQGRSVARYQQDTYVRAPDWILSQKGEHLGPMLTNSLSAGKKKEHCQSLRCLPVSSYCMRAFKAEREGRRPWFFNLLESSNQKGRHIIRTHTHTQSLTHARALAQKKKKKKHSRLGCPFSCSRPTNPEKEPQ